MVRGLPTGLLQSVGRLSAAAMTRWWSSSGAERARYPNKYVDELMADGQSNFKRANFDFS